MFEIDVRGLAEIEGGKPPARLAMEPVANVFDEYRGYDESRRKPSYCAVTLTHSANPRGVILTVADDGAGFAREQDVWTLFGTTAKRSAAGVSGRFNLGDKQLIALARRATIKTNALTVEFANGERNVTRHRSPVVSGTIVEALMPWSLKDLDEIRQQLESVSPPPGLAYTVNGKAIEVAAPKCCVNVTLPTVLLADGVLRQTQRKTRVRVFKGESPTLYELGIPVCDLGELGWPWSLDVEQKVPLPPSRDTVSPAYLYRLIGTVLEQSAMDGVKLLTEDEAGAGFIKGAMDWIRDDAALAATVKSIYGENAVRQSSDPIANAQAAASGATLVSGRWFGEETRRRMESANVLPTSKAIFGGADAMPKMPADGKRCVTCGRAFEAQE